MIGAGALDRRVQLQAPTGSRDGVYGSELPGWTTQATVWAQVTERTVSEDAATGQRVARRSVTVRIRWRNDVRGTWRVVYGTRSLRLSGEPIERGRHQWLDLECEEITNG